MDLIYCWFSKSLHNDEGPHDSFDAIRGERKEERAFVGPHHSPTTLQTVESGEEFTYMYRDHAFNDVALEETDKETPPFLSHN